MAGSDIRDIMELSAPSDAPRPAKRAQPAAAAPRLTGISREVYALMGDRAPPIPLGDQATKYKSKPKYQQREWKPRRWEQRAFVNGGRKDGLVLRHWKLTNPVAAGERIPIEGMPAPRVDAPTGEEVGGMVVKTSEDGKQITTRFSDEFPMEKFNVKVQVPRYTEEQYNTHMKSDDWTKEDTDRLMELCRDYDLRWFVIADRWNFDPEEGQEEKPSAKGDAMDVDSTSGSQASHRPAARSMEQLKARYYACAAAMLAINRPPSDMLPSEYALWEKMQKFDAATETQRKKLAEALFSRSEDEAMEERLLLAELKRIIDHEDQFLAERRDIYSRLESVPSHRREGDQNSYSTSAHLSALLQNLLAKEKRGKVIRAPEAAAPGTATGSAAPTATEPQRTQSWEKGSHPNQYTRRNTNTEDGDNQGPPKKGQPATNLRKLTPAEENKFGVSHHDRLTSGISFRHEKVIKLTQAKSQAQTQKLQSALTELQIPPRLVMPTEKVCKEFERLVQSVNLLLDVRKLSEKVKNDVGVLEEAKRIRLGLPKEEGKDTPALEAGTQDTTHGADGAERAVDDSQLADAKADDEAGAAGAEEDGDESKMEADSPKNDEDDAEEDEEEEIEESKVDLEEDEEDDGNANDSGAEVADDDEEGDQDQEEDDEEDEEDDEIRGQEDLEVEDEDEEDEELKLGEDHDVDEDDAEEEEEPEEDDAEANDSDNEDEGDPEQEEEDGDQVEGGEDEEEAEPDEQDAAPSLTTRAHKRSASVLSAGSRADSNRSGTGRKRRK